MKRLLLILLTGCILPFSNLAQSHIDIQSPDGYPFFVTMNGALQHSAPSGHVTVTDIKGPTVKTLVEFVDPVHGTASKTIFLKPGTISCYNLVQDARGKYVLQFSYDEHWAGIPADQEGRIVTAYSKTPHEKNVTAPPTPPSPQVQPKQTEKTEPAKSATATRCETAMDEVNFQIAKTSVENRPFEGTKLSAAKQIAKTNCFTSEQVRDMMYTFSFEPSRLDFAKFAYDRTTDPENYHIVNEAFTFDGSVESLNKYISSRK